MLHFYIPVDLVMQQTKIFLWIQQSNGSLSWRILNLRRFSNSKPASKWKYQRYVSTQNQTDVSKQLYIFFITIDYRTFLLRCYSLDGRVKRTHSHSSNNAESCRMNSSDLQRGSSSGCDREFRYYSTLNRRKFLHTHF